MRVLPGGSLYQSNKKAQCFDVMYSAYDWICHYFYGCLSRISLWIDDSFEVPAYVPDTSLNWKKPQMYVIFSQLHKQ